MDCLKKNKISRYMGFGTIKSKNEVMVDNKDGSTESIKCKKSCHSYWFCGIYFT